MNRQRKRRSAVQMLVDRVVDIANHPASARVEGRLVKHAGVGGAPSQNRAPGVWIRRRQKLGRPRHRCPRCQDEDGDRLGNDQAEHDRRDDDDCRTQPSADHSREVDGERKEQHEPGEPGPIAEGTCIVYDPLGAEKNQGDKKLRRGTCGRHMPWVPEQSPLLRALPFTRNFGGQESPSGSPDGDLGGPRRLISGAWSRCRGPRMTPQVEPGSSIAVRRMAGIGATSPSTAASAKVGSPPENEPALAGGRRRGRCILDSNGEA